MFVSFIIIFNIFRNIDILVCCNLFWIVLIFFFFLSSGMKVGVNKKDEMYNMLVDDFVKKNFSFVKCIVNIDGFYFI